uniref:Uncharacterized protein n=1 Tax=Anguilla anguilla TaxID=7936 RepID=A0A0E9REH5_ANGAN
MFMCIYNIGYILHATHSTEAARTQHGITAAQHTRMGLLYTEQRASLA